MTTNKDVRAKAGKYQITVNADQLARGKGNGSKCCPVYLAITEAFPGFKVKVLRTSVQLFPDKGNKGLYGKLPPVAVQFGYDLDHGNSVTPFSFELVLSV